MIIRHAPTSSAIAPSRIATSMAVLTAALESSVPGGFVPASACDMAGLRTGGSLGYFAPRARGEREGAPDSGQNLADLSV